MSETQRSLTPLVLPRQVISQGDPFSGDLFQRKKLAEKLTTYVDRLRDGAVLAIDAPWGDGKTWFGLNWASYLQAQGHNVVFLDAFEQDYIEDPFMLIAAEIAELFERNQTSAQDMRATAASVMKSILPLATRATLNMVGRAALGTTNLSNDIEGALESLTDDASDAAQKWLEIRIKNHEKEKNSLRSFKEKLAEFCGSQDKPVVFFVDELDRCRPSFAVRLIERIKHFFDVPNLVFVLLINRVQLERSVKGVYGVETDAHAYLSKFVHLVLSLPKETGTNLGRSNFNSLYLSELAKRYRLDDNRHMELEQFIDQLSILASLLGLSFRDLERAMALLVLADAGSSTPYLSWLIALKLKYPDVFSGIVRGDNKSHEKASEILSAMSAGRDVNFWVREYFVALHVLNARGKENLGANHQQALDQYDPGHLRTLNPMKVWLKRLDIAILD